jgi:hypothetical protein
MVSRSVCMSPRSLCRLLLAGGLAAILPASGCCPDVPGQDPKGAQGLSSRTLAAGENAITLAPGQFQVFEVEVAAEQDIEIIALPTEGVILGLGFAVSPDGGEFSAYPGARITSRVGRFRVAPQPNGTDGTGFRFLGTARSAGTWRFSILAQPRIDLALLADTIKSKSVLEALFLLIYILNDEPALTGPLADLLYWSFPEIIMLHEPLDITVRVSAAGAGEFINPADINDGSSGGNGGGGTGDGGGGGDGSGSDGSGGGGSDGSSGGGGDGTGGDGSSGGDNTTPPTDVSVEAIVSTGDAVPGQDGATFTYFGNPVIDDAGRVAFFAAYEGGSGTGGLYVWEDGTLRTVYEADPNQTGVVPGMGVDDRFNKLTIGWDSGSLHLAWGSDGRLMFAASVNSFTQPNALFRWRASDDDLILVSNAELLRAAIPDASGDFLPEFYHPGLSDDGVAVFSNRYTYFRDDGSFGLFQRGVFTADLDTTEEIGVGTVPGQSQFATFSNKPVLLTSQNGAGDVIFQAEYSPSLEGDRGVYRLHNGGLSRVVDNGPDRTFEGLPIGVQVGAVGEDFEAIALGPQGHIAIETALTIDSETHQTILRWSGTSWSEFRVIADPNTVNLLTGINADGQAAYLADGVPLIGDDQMATNLTSHMPLSLVGTSLIWADYGAAINNNNRAVVRYVRDDATGGSGLALWNGRELLRVFDSTQPVGLDAVDTIFPTLYLGPTEVDRVGTIVTRPETDRPGLSGMFNDNDEMAFRVGYLGPDGVTNTADDQQAILLGRGQ